MTVRPNSSSVLRHSDLQTPLGLHQHRLAFHPGDAVLTVQDCKILHRALALYGQPMQPSKRPSRATHFPDLVELSRPFKPGPGLQGFSLHGVVPDLLSCVGRRRASSSTTVRKLNLCIATSREPFSLLRCS